MKIKILIVAAISLLSTIWLASAQTNGILGSLAQPVATVATYLEANTNAPMATNWTVAPYVSKAGSKLGGGLAAVYYINPYVGTQIRGQYLDMGDVGSSKVWLPNGTITLQSAYQPFGSGIPLTVRPLVELGAATDLSGNLMAIAGVGAEIDLYHTSSNALIQRISLFGGYEKWSGRNVDMRVEQFGLAVNLNVGNILKKIFH